MQARPFIDFCADCLAHGNCVLATLDALLPAKRAIDIVRSGPVKTYRSGEYILHQDVPYSLAPVICQGLVAIVVFTEGGEEILLHALGPGNIVGLSDWLQGRGTCSLAAKAVTEVAISYVTADDPMTLLKRRDATSTAFLKQLGASIQTAQRATIGLRRKDASVRMLLAIHELIRLLQLNQESPVTMPYKIPRWFFAVYTELRPETVSRMLTRLRNEGLIAYRNRRLVIPDLRKLVWRMHQHSSPPD